MAPSKKTATKKTTKWATQHQTKFNTDQIFTLCHGWRRYSNYKYLCTHRHTHEIMFNLLQFLGDSNTMVISCASVHVIGLKERYLCPPHPIPFHLCIKWTNTWMMLLGIRCHPPGQQTNTTLKCVCVCVFVVKNF